MNQEVNSFLSDKSIEEYVKGCEEMAVTLDDVVTSILEKGKKPTILIPSRGAVPIYLIATGMLGDLDPDHILLNPDETRYYPDNIFEYLSEGRIKQNHTAEPKVEVILYPFTADVRSEGKQELLARQFRFSATGAFLDLVKGCKRSLDLNWYFFLMNKMRSHAYHDDDLSPSTIVKSLKSIESSDDRQVVLIDTVISGRASSQILSAFNNLGHPAVPILAVNEVEGSNQFNRNLSAQIRRDMSWWDFMDKPMERALIKFPLITEDKGATLLGVTAVNFTNFNELGYFFNVDGRFSKTFLPQSCVWALPPKYEVSSGLIDSDLRDAYVGAFHRFITRCLTLNGDEKTWQSAKESIKAFSSSYGGIDPREIQAMANVDKETIGNESSSHIMSFDLKKRQAEDWVREYIHKLEMQGIF